MRRRITRWWTVRAGDLRVGDVLKTGGGAHRVLAVAAGGTDAAVELVGQPAASLDDRFVVIQFETHPGTPLGRQMGQSISNFGKGHVWRGTDWTCQDTDVLVEVQISEVAYFNDPRSIENVPLPGYDDE